jgi:hypothetical protein
VVSEKSTKKLFPRGVAETLLVAFFFHGYGAPIFDPVRPGFLDAPLYEYRMAVSTVSKGQQIGLDKPLVDALRPVKEAVRTAMAPAREKVEEYTKNRR